jgi:ubiquinone biosynthesis protein
MTEELDFDYEASSMRRMRRTLRRHKIYVPRVYERYSGKRVLTTEFIHAVLMADYIEVARENPRQLEAWIAENNIDPRRLARRMINSLFRQLFEDNLYHVDMHPGNIVLLRDSKVALIDFGTTNFTEGDYLRKFEIFARALATRDYEKAADLCFMLCAVLPNFDLEEVKNKVVRTIRAWATRTLVRQLPYHAKSIDSATIEIMKVLVGYRCAMDWAWLRIHRATSTLDASLIHLYPGVNYTKVVQEYFQNKDRRELNMLLGPAMAARSVRGAKKALDIQDRLDEYTMFQGSLIRRHAQVFEVATDKVAAVVSSALAVLAMVLLIPGLILLLVIGQQYFPEFTATVIGPQLLSLVNQIPALEPQVWLVILILNVYVLVVLGRLRSHLRRKGRGSHESVATV